MPGGPELDDTSRTIREIVKIALICKLNCQKKAPSLLENGGVLSLTYLLESQRPGGPQSAFSTA